MKNKIRNHINNVYIVLYEAYLEDFMPNWKHYLTRDLINGLELLIMNFKKCNKLNDSYNYEHVPSLNALYTFLLEFYKMTSQIISILQDITTNEILHKRFSLISNFSYKSVNELKNSDC